MKNEEVLEWSEQYINQRFYLYVDISKTKEVSISYSIEGAPKTTVVALEEALRGVCQNHQVCNAIDTIGYYLTRDGRNEILDVISDQGKSIIKGGVNISLFSKLLRSCEGGKIMLFALHSAKNGFIKSNSKTYMISAAKRNSIRNMMSDGSGMSNLQLFLDFKKVIDEIEAGISTGDTISNQLFVDLQWLLKKLQSEEKIEGENFTNLGKIVKNLSNWQDKHLIQLCASLEIWLAKSKNQTIYFKNITVIMLEAALKSIDGFDHDDAVNNAEALGHEIMQIYHNYLKFSDTRKFTSCQCSHKTRKKCFKPKCGLCEKIFNNFITLVAHLRNHRDKRNHGIRFDDFFLEIMQKQEDNLLFPETLGFDRIIVGLIFYIVIIF